MRNGVGCELSTALKIDDVIDEGWGPPRLPGAESLLQLNDVRRCLLDDGVASNLKLTKDGRLSRARCTGENIPSHDRMSVLLF